MLGTEVDLAKVTVDSYVVAGIADHICPWQSCYRSTQLLGGDSRFVLSTNGHIAALVNPPTNPKSSYQRTADGQDNPPDPQAWLDVGARPSRVPGGRTTPDGSASGPGRGGPRPRRRWATRGSPARRGARQLRLRQVSVDHADRRRAQRPDTVTRRARGQARLRVAVRPATGTGRRCCCATASGSSLEVLQPFLDALDPRREVIRFDVPGVGGSPRPRAALPLSPSPGGRRHARPAGPPALSTCSGLSWGGGLAQQFAVAAPAARAAGWSWRRPATGMLMVPAHPRVLSKMLTPRRHRDPGYARQIAGEIYGGTMRDHPDRADAAPARPPRLGSARGYSTSSRRHGVDQPADAAADPAAHAGAGRRRRPDHPAGQRADDGPADPERELHLYGGGHLGILIKAGELADVVSGFLTAQKRRGRMRLIMMGPPGPAKERRPRSWRTASASPPSRPAPSSVPT